MNYLEDKSTKQQMADDMVDGNGTGNMLTIREAAGLLHIHPNTLRRWCDEGRIRAYRITSRGDRRFTRQDIARFLAEFNGYKGNGDNSAQPDNELPMK